MRLTASEATDCVREAATWLNSPYFSSPAALACAAWVSCWAWAMSLLCVVILLAVST
jgi:hypothetical protein